MSSEPQPVQAAAAEAPAPTSKTEVTEVGAKPSKTQEAATVITKPVEHDEEYYTKPDFIYGGPFIPVKLPSPFLDTAAPMNIPLSGTFRKSFAYYSLKERLPVILTKIIDQLSRDGAAIKTAHSASDDDIKSFMQTVTKLKNDLVTNKDYEPLLAETADAEKWNKLIESQDIKKYFLNSWMFTECYVYRKLKDGCEITKGLQNFDYFETQKNKSFEDNVEIMCLVADRVVNMVNKSEKDKRKADFVTLLKICLWANKCDLSLSLGSQMNLIQAAADITEKIRLNPPPAPPAKGKKKKAKGPVGPIIISPDPFQMILDLKDKVLVDNCNKIADAVVRKSEQITEKIEKVKAGSFKGKCSCHRLAKKAGLPLCTQEAPPEPETKEEPSPKPSPKKIPCPAKMTAPQSIMFDIVCDNTGYELFADLCLAHFLLGQKIVEKVRFHVKNMPWFVSDVTPKDFQYVINACINSKFSKPSSTGSVDESGAPKLITADNLRTLGLQWKEFFNTGVFLVTAEDYWTYPYNFKDMKRLDPQLYRKLQTACAIMFKGDLNYRKLMGDVNCNPSLGMLAALQGFIPAPIIAVRTVKSETICGLPRGKWAALTDYDPKWMQSGDYGVIQYCPKAEALKVSDRPCVDYCTTCFGVICPEHDDL